MATNESERMIAEQDCSEPYWENYEADSYCEPDEEDFAYMIAQEREVASLRSESHDADQRLRNYQKYTDRQLRALSKKKKGCERDLAQAHQFDVVSDSFDVEIADDVWDTVPWPYDEGEDVSDRASRDLKGLAARNACTSHGTARKRRFQLLRDLKAIELRHGALDTAELMLTFDEWYRLSQPFLDSQKTRDNYLAAFLAEFGKVRVPTGEGQTIEEALAYVSHLSSSKLPVIPDMPEAPESWRRIAALHRELARRSANGIYFLTCRDAAKASPGLSHQAAYNINLALAQLGVIEIVGRGDSRPNGGKAAQFRYLRSHSEDGVEEDADVEI